MINTNKPLLFASSLPGRSKFNLLSWTLAILLLFVLLISSCSSTPDLWYKTDATQNNFDLDSRECEIIAEKYTLQQSETGKRIDPDNFSQQFLQCLNNKGWSQINPETSQTNDQSLQPTEKIYIEREEQVLSGFNLHINIPDNFSLLSRQEARIGPTIMEQFFWQNEGNTYINLIFQQNNVTTFEHTAYPVADPYYLYTSRIDDSAQDLLQWSAFYGKIQNEWVMGIGAFYLANNNQRLIIVITKNLNPPSAPPPSNLTLSSNQYEQIDVFSNYWSTWLEKQFPKKHRWTDWLKKLIQFSL